VVNDPQGELGEWQGQMKQLTKARNEWQLKTPDTGGISPKTYEIMSRWLIYDSKDLGNSIVLVVH